MYFQRVIYLCEDQGAVVVTIIARRLYQSEPRALEQGGDCRALVITDFETEHAVVVKKLRSVRSDCPVGIEAIPAAIERRRRIEIPDLRSQCLHHVRYDIRGFETIA